MKLASLEADNPDGRLLLVSRDLSRAVEADGATTMQAALDEWANVAPSLEVQYKELNRDPAAGNSLDLHTLAAAIPRSYQFLDASAFLAHNHILAEAWGFARRTEADPPLMYQGLSDHYYPAHGEVPFRSVKDEIDLEAEFGVITDRVPMAIDANRAVEHIRLIVMVNDWSLRAYGPAEMQAGFGFLHAKPPSALSAIAVTPDELADAWCGGKVCLPIHIQRAGRAFGAPHGGEMSYHFGELIAHAARTRELCPGTVIGSGTVSNAAAKTTGSGCIAERRALDTIAGKEPTSYLSFGEQVGLDCLLPSGESVFGPMSHEIVPA